MQKVLLTGGSRGIGLALASAFAAKGYSLMLVDKADGALTGAIADLQRRFPGLAVEGLEINLAEPGSAALVYQHAKAKDFLPEVLVNNAGFGTYGFTWESDIQRQVDMLQLHVVTLYQLTHLFLGEMVHRNSGWIINISSISAFQPNPRLGNYGASKSFVLQFTRSLDLELQEAGLAVRAMAVCPTPVRETSFMATAGMERTRTFQNWMVVTPKIVVRDILRGMAKGKNLVVPGRGFPLLLKILKRLPEALLIWLSAHYLREK